MWQDGTVWQYQGKSLWQDKCSKVAWQRDRIEVEISDRIKVEISDKIKVEISDRIKLR